MREDDVDDNEADYLRNRVRGLERSLAGWRVAAGLLAGALALVLAVAAVGGLVLAPALARQGREDVARRAAVSNLKQIAVAEQADAPGRGAEWRAREQAASLAPVAGGIGVAALDPGDD